MDMTTQEDCEIRQLQQHWLPHVHSFDTRPRHDVLPFRGPGNMIVTNKDTNYKSKVACLRTKMKTKRQSPLKVWK